MNMAIKKNLGIDFCGVHFVNPLMLSSSPVSNTAEMISRCFEAGFGGVVYKTVGLDNIKIIHPSPRMKSFDYQDKQLVGLQNVEQTSDRPTVDNFQDMAYLKKRWPDRVVISSVMGWKRNEWHDLARMSEDAGVDILELNFSCPHMTVEGAGMKVGQAHALVQDFTEIACKAVKIPIIAKLTPNITDITEPAVYAKQGGAVGITAVNTVAGLTGVDLKTLTPQPNVFGLGAVSGFSGPAIKPIGLRAISQLARHPNLKLPLSGVGGIETWVDALEYILLGASTLQITTGVIHYGYRIVEDILEGLAYFMEERGVERLSDLVGKSVPKLVSPNDFDLSRQGIANYDLKRCIGCGQCHIVCQDAGGQCLSWDAENRRPVMDEKKCLSCMVCSFICPIADPPLITYKEVPNKPEILPPVSVL
jgi:dihydropyrimidine dehydrogenase (NAD+) subunit PreA